MMRGTAEPILYLILLINAMTLMEGSTTSDSNTGDECCLQAIKLAGCEAMEANGNNRPQSCSLLEQEICNDLRNNANSELPSFCSSSLQLPQLDNATSCANILAVYPSAPSGMYTIDYLGVSQEVYCDMNGINCDGEGGWTRVAYINMNDSDSTCPFALLESTINLPQGGSQRLCRIDPSSSCEANSASIPVPSNYSHVCGRVVGYQFASLNAFVSSISLGATIDGVYVDGVSITHGESPMRTHIWSYAAGLSEYLNASSSAFETNNGCPCNSGSNLTLPSFVDDNYYCESGLSYSIDEIISGIPQIPREVFIDDTLWDGEQCNGPEAGCCPDGSKQPWFSTELPQATSDNVDVRPCIIDITNGNLYLELIELYIR